MKRLAFIFALCVGAAGVSAQEVKGIAPVADTTGVVLAEPANVIVGGRDASTDIYVSDGYGVGGFAPTDSLHLPVLNGLGQTYMFHAESGRNVCRSAYRQIVNRRRRLSQ